MNIKHELVNSIKKSLIELNISYDGEIIIEIPKNATLGNYSSNIAMVLAKTLKDSPINIGNKIIKEIQGDFIDHVEVVNPGFINFFIKQEFYIDNLNNIINEKKKYGKIKRKNPKKINIEFVSVNPTGTMHVGHARGATYGDNLSRILTFYGYNVTKEYYINDAGNQINNLGKSIKERYRELCGLSFNLSEDDYHGNEIIEIAKKIYKEYNNKKINEPIEYFREIGLDILLKGIKKDLDNYRVNFDVWTSERSLYESGLVDETFNRLKDSDNCYIHDGALWLGTSNHGDEKDRVIVKSDGNYTYLLPDIAYHVDKIKRGYDELINVLGSDHHGYIERLRASLKILGYDENILDIKILQMVRVLKDGEELKLSKRTGKTLTLEDLVSDIGVNATRYFFSSKSIDSQMDFNLDIASSQTNDNPIYYIEYANARICSILKKAKKLNITIPDYFNNLNSDNEINILSKLYEFNDIIEIAALKKLPHLITNYVYELASLFHNYYSNHQIITDDLVSTSERVSLLYATKIILNNSLDLIGIIPREEM